MADMQTGQRLGLAGSELGPRSALRLRRPRTERALGGLFVVALAVVVVSVMIIRAGDRHDVLAVSRTVLAGEQLTDADLRVVSISADDSFPSVPATARSSIVGQYAKVRLADGSLVVADSVQARPLVDPAKVLMSVAVPLSGVPTGLREGSRLVLVVTPEGTASDVAPVLVEATVAAVPRNLGELVSGSGDSSNSSMVALTVEVDPSAAATLGPAKAVAVAVLAPDGTLPTAPAASTGDATASSTPSSAPP